METSKIMLCSDYLNSKKILFHFGKHIEEIYTGKTDFNPLAIEIHPTARCNHRCIHCSYKERNEARNEISKEVMAQLTDDVIHMGVEAVYFSGGGEPTLYPNLAEYVTRLSDAGIEVALITNGTYFEKAGLVDIAEKFNYIAFSVPGVTNDIFGKITGANLLENVLSVPQKIKEKHGENSPVLGARVVLTNINYMQIGLFMKTLKERQFDYALFKIVRDYEDNGQGLGQKEEEILIQEIEKLGEIDDNFTNVNFLFNYRKSVPFEKNCWINHWGWLANVSTDGKVYPNIVEIDHPEFCIGDLNEERLPEMWNSKQHQIVKKISQDKWLNGECKNCRAISYNSIINTQLEQLPSIYDPFI